MPAKKWSRCASDVTCLLIRTAGLRLMFKQKELAPFKKMIDDRYRARTLANHLRNVSLFGNYQCNTSHDLPGTPSDPYNFAADCGRSWAVLAV